MGTSKKRWELLFPELLKLNRIVHKTRSGLINDLCFCTQILYLNTLEFRIKNIAEIAGLC